MTQDEIIAYANANYRVGISFQSIFSDGGIIREIGYFNNETDIQWRYSDNRVSAYNGIKTLRNSGLQASPVIYKNGKWAPILNYELY